MTKVFRVLLIMSWTRGGIQHERTCSIGITGSFQATSERIPKDFRKTSRVSSRDLESSESAESPERSIDFSVPGALQVTRKIDPRSTQNRAREVPWGHSGPPWGLPGAGPGLCSGGTENVQKIEGFWKAPEVSREAPGNPAGPEKSTKYQLFNGKGHSKRGIFVDLYAQSHFSCF